MAWLCHRYKQGRKTKWNSGQAHWKKISGGKSEPRYWTIKTKLHKKRNTDRDWWGYRNKGDGRQSYWSRMRAGRIRGCVQRGLLCCFDFCFNFMINESNNDKIQGVTWEWWLQLTSELQKITSPGTEKPGSWALKSSKRLKVWTQREIGEPFAKWSVSDCPDREIRG